MLCIQRLLLLKYVIHKFILFKYHSKLTNATRTINLLPSFEGDMKICFTQKNWYVTRGRYEFSGWNKSSCLPTNWAITVDGLIFVGYQFFAFFMVFLVGPIHECQCPRINDFLYELWRKIRWPQILNPTNVSFSFNPRKLVPTKIKPSTVIVYYTKS